MKRKLLMILAVALSMWATAALAQYWDNGWNGVKIGAVHTTAGTRLNRFEVVNLTFTNASSTTTTMTAIDSGAAYYVLTGWKTNSANSTVITSISGTTLTATASAATTGVLSAMVVQTPP